jgi:hypothetical protein
MLASYLKYTPFRENVVRPVVLLHGRCSTSIKSFELIFTIKTNLAALLQIIYCYLILCLYYLAVLVILL